MLHDSGLSESFWAEACNTANYLVNRSPTKALDNMTPYEAWNGSKPSLHHLQHFGCNTYLHVPAAKHTELQAKSCCCTMLGYIHNTTKIWRLWDPIQKGIINASNVTFDEDSFSALGKPARPAVPLLRPAFLSRHKPLISRSDARPNPRDREQSAQSRSHRPEDLSRLQRGRRG